MNFKYSDEQIDIIREIGDFTTQRINKLDYIQRGDPFSRIDWEVCGEVLLHGLPIPAEFGGRGLDALSTAMALEELSYRSEDNGLPFAIAAQMLSCIVPVYQAGNDDQKNELLPRLCDGSRIMANSITEESTGSDVYRMASRAEDKGDHFILNAEKTMITNAPLADISLVYVNTAAEKGYFGGTTAFLIDHSTGGVQSDEVLEKIGLESVQMGRQYYRSVRLDSNHILGQKGGGGPLFQLSMEWERACLGAVHVGSMKKILEYIMDFVKKRKVGGQYIGKYQAIAHKVAEMKVNLHTSRLLLYQAAWNLDNGNNPGLTASMAKLKISEAYQKMCRDAFTILGGRAYLKGNFIEKHLRDSLSATVYSGTSEIQKNIIASYLKI